jgi:hypothetical protein
MAVWRTKATSMFGFRANAYSYAQGKTILFADLVEFTRRALDDGDSELLRRIAEYVTWAMDQDSDELASVVDLGFFLPIFRNPDLQKGMAPYFPTELVEAKRQLLMDTLP